MTIYYELGPNNFGYYIIIEKGIFEGVLNETLD